MTENQFDLNDRMKEMEEKVSQVTNRADEVVNENDKYGPDLEVVKKEQK